MDAWYAPQPGRPHRRRLRCRSTSPTATTWSDEIDWVGTAFTPSGVSIDYPGWRPIELSDIVPGTSPLNFYMPGTDMPMTPDERAQFVFNGLILDPSSSTTRGATPPR